MHRITKVLDEFEALTVAAKSQDKFERRRTETKVDAKVGDEETLSVLSKVWDNAEKDNEVTAAIVRDKIE